MRPCSTLRRVEPYATEAPGCAEIRQKHLQYPQTGRTLCNQAINAWLDAKYKLAVPSDGSNPMQPPDSSSLPGPCRSCSTLRRVEPYATIPPFLASCDVIP